MTGGKAPLLAVKNLCAGYGGGDVIGGINLEAESGKILCVAGPNGCGKSTLLKALARILPCRGSIVLDGKDCAACGRRELARRIAFVSQASELYFPYTVYETVAMGRYAHDRGGFFSGVFAAPGYTSRAGRAVIEAVLDTLGLNAVRGAPISELSGGQLQLVFLGRALVQDPRLLLLDEPTNHLDLKHQITLLEHLRAWVRDGAGEGRAVIAVLHDLNLARCFADNAVLMDGGAIAVSGGAPAVFSDGALSRIYGMDVGDFMRRSLGRWA
ncbi:MAG: ABC transporter ATP-binding protein [Treponema sp.]|nr:ABC transporter ATP-binding protein [Treponema sp.]